ncbi:TPA: GNAT family N-acetyltransferase [Klebsiella aerogenes]|uniref:GNAT family N-acetyltransferase n=1 Tax=Klebsiella aerogenes TaxID=548 RepID=UPI000B4229B4|nr:GNAT family N-acetyltransferase [Klebsiella aerogenes]ELA2681520.1 GNAT family N-acetyltransferase [Klebsiella aerogenes]RNT31238.1 GNAT family N-acetyltransferase [Klebsiella aerogenes]RSV80465.1 GNAT family N-acetyltransferase [Klebsiella aerogenes]HBT2490075.1 GNAT family N-acetyltransferase [Klebsiella aerogenes]HBT2500665.1 GNAT family N-acetyltransferase [Klebsiella aerogenes]
MKIYQAQPQDIEKILPLFIAYHDFYNVDSNKEEAFQYLLNRVKLGESVIYYIEDDNEVVGFTQLYPLFCSLEMKRIWLLYDLFVKAEYRKKGIAKALIQRAEQLAMESNSAFIMLSTGIDNLKAQSLYEKNGFVRDNDFYVYNKIIA